MTTQKIKALLQAQLKQENNDLSEFSTLLLAAEANKWQINKRIEKYLPAGCSYYIEYNLYYVKFPSGNTHLLGWVGSTKEMSAESLRHSDSCHSNGSEKRIQQLERILMTENLAPFCKLFINLYKAVKAVNAAMDAIKDNKAEGYYNPSYYPLLKMAGISQDIWFKLEDIKKAN